jgi:nitrite reductase/ring-hydroxylating ferredoxin subunit
MMDEIDLGPLEAREEGDTSVEGPFLRTGPGGERFACVRGADGKVHVLADACPHEGHPLSSGALEGGVLVCRWHGWRFDVVTGERVDRCGIARGEAARRHESRVDERGHLRVIAGADRATERARIERSLRAQLREARPGGCTRDAIRLAALEGERGIGAAFEVILGDALARGDRGFAHPEASAIDVWTWVARGWLPGEEAVAALVTLVGEPLQHLGPRAIEAPLETPWDDADSVTDALGRGAPGEAEGRIRALGALDAERAIARGVIPFLRRGLLDYGHGAIFTGKAVEVVRAFPALGEAACASLAVMLSEATNETALATWSATREAVARSSMIDRVGATPIDAQARATYETQVLAGEREAVTATLELVARGFDVAGVLRAIGHAAAMRMRRFDLAWTRRLDASVGFLDVTHAVTCARAMQELWALDPRVENVPLAVLAASFVGKLRSADDPDPRPPDAFVGDARASRLVDAVRAREPARARAITARIDRATRLEAYRGLAPFAAFEAAVRPVYLAHAVKTTEALYRMEIDDPREGAAYLDALVRYLGTPLPERSFFRTASMAKQAVGGGKPPEGLY